MKLFALLLMISVVHGDNSKVWQEKTFANAGETCSEAERIYQGALDLAACKAQAEGYGNATFIYFQSAADRSAGVWCHIYTSCEETRVPSVPGTNYEFVSIEAEKKCDDLEAWCPEIDTAVDCCAPYIQTKCPGSCDTCPAIHCVWDNWVIGTCSAECGPGTRTNTRVKLVEESNGGTCTGKDEEVLECMDKECPVHCEWNDWIIQDCSLSCGGGTRTLTRTINQTALHGGNECPDANVTSIEESCNVQECPVDCEWSEWTAGECSKTCGDGLRINQRFKVTEAMYGGAPCQGEIEMTEDCLDRICPEQCCVANGVSDACLGLCIEEVTEIDRFVSVCDKFDDVVEKCTIGSGDTCTCSHLANVTASVGEMYCTNDETRYCDTNRECYTTEAFNYGQWEIGGQNNGAICRDLPVTEE